MKAAYFTIDIPNESAKESLEILKIQYGLETTLVNIVDNRCLYLGILKNNKFLKTRTDDNGNTIPSIFDVFSSLNPIVVGVVDKEGIPDPDFPFNIPELMSHLPKKIIVEQDEDGNVISKTEESYTEPFLPLIPFGWKKPVFQG